jgi:Lrp/AsnC family leucine-responsive transcriptional regulator
MALIHISMDQHTPERFTSFEARVAENPGVLECLLITGQDADYQLKVVVRDMDAYQELLLNRITASPADGVTGVHSAGPAQLVAVDVAAALRWFERDLVADDGAAVR